MSGALAFIRPFAILAALAFVAGFFGYLALGGASPAAADVGVHAEIASGPASAEWNLPKHI